MVRILIRDISSKIPMATANERNSAKWAIYRNQWLDLSGCQDSWNGFWLTQLLQVLFPIWDTTVKKTRTMINNNGKTKLSYMILCCFLVKEILRPRNYGTSFICDRLCLFNMRHRRLVQKITNDLRWLNTIFTWHNKRFKNSRNWWSY